MENPENHTIFGILVESNFLFRRSARRQGERSEMKHLLLRVIPEAPEYRERGTKDRNEGAGEMATLN